MGPLLVLPWVGKALGAEARRREGGEEAEGQQEHRGDPVEATFEAREGHDTHL